MTLARFCAATLVVGAATLPMAAMAESSRLNVIIGGEAYDGPPRFEVTFDGEILGQGVVNGAIDTVKAGRFADAADKTPYVQAFEFDIPEFIFKPDGEVRVRLLNEAYGGEGSDRDRNLFLAAVTVNGGAVTVSGLVTAEGDGFRPNEIVGEFLLIADGNEEAVSPAPRGGWPQPLTVVADVREARLLSDHREGSRTLPVPGLTAMAAPDQETASVGEVLPEVTTASIENRECDLDQIYNVIGFNENSNDLTPRLMKRLDQIINDIGDERCRVTVTGYSSTQGTYATNALFAVERAQNVLSYLKANGLKFQKVSAVGGGATEQFGPEFSDNRRVVITVIP